MPKLELIAVPVYLAGGLNTQNVKPCGIELCTGGEQPGKLDKRKLKRLMGAVKSA